MNKLRFAPIIRVSTEKQQKKGESLETQKKQIISYVKNLDGIIPDNCWKYTGQEHATAQFERQKLNQLLSDSDKNKFDAVIVCDASRWSRDNRKSKEGIEILKNNNIRFFMAMAEYDLFNPDQSMLLGITTEMNEFFAKQTAQKSIINRIEKAKKGIPVCGSLPSGRTYDKKTDIWDVNKVFKKKIEQAAAMLLEGKTLVQISKLLNMNRPNLRNILTNSCGTVWTQHFKKDDLKIDEAIETEVPPLLEQDVIDKVLLRMQKNKTVYHKQLKNKYMLGRMILCGHCGRALGGNTRVERKGLQYYRHPKSDTCKHFLFVPCKLIDNAVIIHLFALFGNQTKMMDAVKSAIPDLKDVELKESRIVEIDKELKKVNKRKIRLISLYEDEKISDKDFTPRMSEHKERETLLTDELDKLKTEIDSVPAKKEIKARADLIRATIQSIYSSPDEFESMSFDNKRKLAQLAFSGKDYQGQRAGVYVKKDVDGWSFELKGILPDNSIIEYLPMDKEKQDILLGIEENNKINTDSYNVEQKTLRRGDQP